MHKLSYLVGHYSMAASILTHFIDHLQTPIYGYQSITRTLSFYLLGLVYDRHIFPTQFRKQTVFQDIQSFGGGDSCHITHRYLNGPILLDLLLFLSPTEISSKYGHNAFKVVFFRKYVIYFSLLSCSWFVYSG